jgi:hypothetical protein
MDPPSSQLFDPPKRLETTDPSSAPTPPIPLGPDSDSDPPRITIVGDEYTYDGMRWHSWDRTAVSYAPPQPEDLPYPPTSLVDPHGSIRAARAKIAGTERNAQVERTRSYPISLATAESAWKAVSECAYVPSSGSVRPSASGSASSCPTASLLLSSRDLEIQVEHYATHLQAATGPEGQKAVIEEVMRDEVPTQQAVRQYYRRIAARCIERERERDGRWNSQRGREGMLFGSEVVGDREREKRDEGGGERGGGLIDGPFVLRNI